MKYISIINVLLLLLSSCNPISENNSEAGNDNKSNHVLKPNVINEIDSNIVLHSTKEIKTIFNENTNQLSLIINDNEKITLGKYHNTFNQPPHEIRIEKIDSNKFIIIIATNIIQLGISQDALYVLSFNKLTRKTKKICGFTDLAKYNESSGIDTIQNVQFYNYELLKNELPNTYKFKLTEYKPYKSGNNKLNKSMKTVIREVKIDPAIY